MRISDWSSDVCSSDLADLLIISSMAFAAWAVTNRRIMQSRQAWIAACVVVFVLWLAVVVTGSRSGVAMILIAFVTCLLITVRRLRLPGRSEEHTSDFQSLMRISYDVFCLKTKRQ